MLPNYLIPKTDAKSDAKQIVQGKGYRISVLSNRLFRIELSSNNNFCDNATQSVWFRKFDVKFSVREENSIVRISTEEVTLLFDTKTKHSSILFADGKVVACNNSKNLLGTARTLDQSSGKVKLSMGVASANGVAVIDDNSCLLNANGEVVAPYKCKRKDSYIFAHQKNFQQAVCDLYKICGNVPLIPRYALGNWWSRYHAYTQEEYCELIQQFIDKDIPLTVAVIDMDWHWVDVNSKFDNKTSYGGAVDGDGWTGFSWNTELFPDYKNFLRWLKNKNLKISLNLHPAEGIRNFEDCYKVFCKQMNLPDDGKTIAFDFCSSQFVKAYFDSIMHPYQEDGVDFWWIDWQQGTINGFDPLWSLNHCHYLDNANNGTNALILSRYAGLGSHRYPLGFSGDTQVKWSSLRYQPYFTATASNVGYSWWSHDIGGHFGGERNEELYLRWVQLGVFSPICRLHCGCQALYGKEPWNYRKDVEIFATKFLRLRHKLIPYLYSLNYLTHTQGLALCQPMYYSYPDCEQAYCYGNQFMFGDLLVSPIVSKTDKQTGLAGVKTWLPQGRWTDIFTDFVYSGNKEIELYRELYSIPVLAEEGAIIPLSADNGNGCGNPENLEIWAYRGNGNFDMYEDDGKQESAVTNLCISENDGKITFALNTSGHTEILPKKRNIKLVFRDIFKGEITVNIDGYTTTFAGNTAQFNLMQGQSASIEAINYQVLNNTNLEKALAYRIRRIQGSNRRNDEIYGKLYDCMDKKKFIEILLKTELSEIAKKSIIELIDGE